MKKHTEIIVHVPGQQERDLLLAELTLLGFEGFEEDGEVLKAYIQSDDLDQQALDALAESHRFTYSSNTIEARNWNAEWESSFSPVTVEDFVSIRAQFHQPVGGVQYEIVITPKMSFGTGHHATTWLMMRAMKDIDLAGKHVLDLGTGTGVLAILAEKLGASEVIAIDNDEWSVHNALENALNNHCERIQVELKDRVPEGSGFDVILANINKHILLNFCGEICEKLRPGGQLLLSGILPEDKPDIIKAYGIFLGEPVKIAEKNNWVMISFNK
jgi:ribosomal protein L11 methyltransferase